MNSEMCINIILIIGIIALILGNYSLASDLHKRNAETESNNKIIVFFIGFFYYLCLIGFIELYTHILSEIFNPKIVWTIAILISFIVCWVYRIIKK